MWRPGGVQLLLEQVGDGRLAGARQAGEPQHRRPLVLQFRTRSLGDVERLPMDVRGTAQRVEDHAGADRGVGQPVDQHERAGHLVFGEGIEGERRLHRDVADADLVEFQRLCRLVGEIVDVDPVFQLGDRGVDLVRLGAHQIGAARQKRVFVEPDDVGGELVGDVGPGFRRHQHVAARDLDFVVEHERDGLPLDGGIKIAVMGDDAPNGRALAGLRDHHGVARRNRTGGDGPGKSPEVEIGAVYVLHGEAERRALGRGRYLDRLQVVEQDRPAIPGHLLRRAGDVVAVARGHGYRRDRLEAEALGELRVVGRNALEHRLVEADQVDLVHRDHDMPDAQERGDDGMAARLRQDALARVHQHDRKVGGRGAGRHVARVLLMTRRVGDDELALRGREEAVGNVDRDALLALRLETIDQQREIDVVAGRAVLAGIGGKRGELVLEDQLRVVEKPADQRRLAVVHRPAGQEPQQRLLLLRGQVGLEVGALGLRGGGHRMRAQK